MKTLQNTKLLGMVLIAFFAISLVSCKAKAGVSVGVGTSSRTAVKTKPLPPGQAKKVYGGKSARRYAPGQNKQ